MVLQGIKPIRIPQSLSREILNVIRKKSRQWENVTVRAYVYCTPRSEVEGMAVLEVEIRRLGRTLFRIGSCKERGMTSLGIYSTRISWHHHRNGLAPSCLTCGTKAGKRNQDGDCQGPSNSPVLQFCKTGKQMISTRDARTCIPEE